ncbi:MAG: hypothetical protein R3E64_06155 [Halioglobus sp.]
MPDKPDSAGMELEAAQLEIVQMRRELLRWKMLARQHEARVRDMEGSASWRWTALLRVLPEVRRRWKVLLLLGVVLVLSLPLWPAILITMMFADGRAFIWSLIWKVRPLHDLLSFLKQRLQKGGGHSRGRVSATTPVLFQRPTEAYPISARNDPQLLQRHFMQQLCPQQRVLMERYKLSRHLLVKDDELPELLSLHSAEIGMLRMVVSQYQDNSALKGQTE